ncbi:hypothetical protein BsIDN1_05380 [Bacillus safensis]|uniref:Peptidase M20 dimerisation domain-containing protein n=1 Tax=Bacillus safensis TaxID=561879 RepID=A0A5S9LZW6_BACIA|nr:hypothetical protein BsIDN1_05380 [Bacillus safensis]
MTTLTNEMKQTVTDIFEHLHAHPEISWEETETTAYIEDILKKIGLQNSNI